MQRAAKPGYNPAAGRAEPGEGRSDGNFTHSPHRNGTVCGLAITDASAYTVDEPSCSDCKRHYDAVQRSRSRMEQRQAAVEAPAPTSK